MQSRLKSSTPIPAAAVRLMAIPGAIPPTACGPVVKKQNKNTTGTLHLVQPSDNFGSVKERTIFHYLECVQLQLQPVQRQLLGPWLPAVAFAGDIGANQILLCTHSDILYVLHPLVPDLPPGLSSNFGRIHCDPTSNGAIHHLRLAAPTVRLCQCEG